MWIGSFVCLSFKRQLLEGLHNFGVDSFRLALYTDQAILDVATEFYAPNGEVLPLDGYTTGGQVLNVYPPKLINTSAVIDIDDVAWANSSITARGAMAYNASKPGYPALFVLDFGANRISNAGNFVVSFPLNPILRIV